MPNRDIVAIGGSAGSVAVLKALLAELPADFPGSLFITTHIPSATPSLLPDMLRGASRIPVRRAVDGMQIEPGHVYVAAQDRHLLLIGGALRLGWGPKENMARPAIDPMFRSAALTYDGRAVGIVLTGMLSDGAAGLFALKQRGGTAVVQHPVDAEADSMPRAALEAVEADFVVRADELADLITEIVRTPATEAGPVSDELIFEVEVAAGARLGSDLLGRIGTPTPLTCPDCHGVLSEVKDGRPLRYRCQIGHAFTAGLLARQTEPVDQAIRIAMRVMEERAEFVSRMARDARENGRSAVAELYEKRVEEYQAYARTLREAAILSLRMARGDPEQPV